MSQHGQNLDFQQYFIESSGGVTCQRHALVSSKKTENGMSEGQELGVKSITTKYSGGRQLKNLVEVGFGSLNLLPTFTPWEKSRQSFGGLRIAWCCTRWDQG